MTLRAIYLDLTNEDVVILKKALSYYIKHEIQGDDDPRYWELEDYLVAALVVDNWQHKTDEGIMEEK